TYELGVFSNKGTHMKNRIVISLALALASQGAFAGLLTLKDGTFRSIKGVNVAPGATASVADRKTDLTTVGAGNRVKWINQLIHPNVYVASLMVSDVTKYATIEARKADSMAALTSSDAETAVAIRLDFTFGVNSGQLVDAFNEAFDANK